MPAEPMTTIKVPKRLHERVARDAAREGLTAAGFISALVDEHDRKVRLEAVRKAYAEADHSYEEEVESWDSLAGDGLES